MFLEGRFVVYLFIYMYAHVHTCMCIYLIYLSIYLSIYMYLSISLSHYFIFSIFSVETQFVDYRFVKDLEIIRQPKCCCFCVGKELRIYADDKDAVA